jgi:hypothetical protein
MPANPPHKMSTFVSAGGKGPQCASRSVPTGSASPPSLGRQGALVARAVAVTLRPLGLVQSTNLTQLHAEFMRAVL